MALAVYNANMKKKPANNIFRLRKDRGWTQQQLADAITSDGRGIVGKDQVSKHESGDRQLNPSWMHRYARALGCRPGDIISQGNNLIDASDRFQAAEALEESLFKDVKLLIYALLMENDKRVTKEDVEALAKEFTKEVTDLWEAGHTDERPSLLAVNTFLKRKKII